MPKKVENKLRQEAIKRRMSGKKADAYVYGTMNKLGLMHGNKRTDTKKSKQHEDKNKNSRAMIHQMRRNKRHGHNNS